MFRKLFGKERPKTVCISFPKSGRTWLRYGLRLASADVKFSHAGHGVGVKGMGRPFKGLNKRFFGEKNIFLYRNPLDTAVSMFHQIHNTNFQPGNAQYERIKKNLVSLKRLPPESIDDFVLDPFWGCGNIAAFNATHKAHFENRSASMIACYEDLCRDPHANFARILDFIGVTDYDIERIVKESSFDKMRALEISGDAEALKSNRLHGLRNNDANTLKVRRGKVRGYGDALKAETIEAATEICRRSGQEI